MPDEPEPAGPTPPLLRALWMFKDDPTAPCLVAVRNDLPLGSAETRGAIAKAFDTNLLVAKIAVVLGEGGAFKSLDLDLDFKPSDFDAPYSQKNAPYSDGPVSMGSYLGLFRLFNPLNKPDPSDPDKICRLQVTFTATPSLLAQEPAHAFVGVQSLLRGIVVYKDVVGIAVDLLCIAVQDDLPIGSPETRAKISKAFGTDLQVAKISCVQPGNPNTHSPALSFDLNLDFKPSDAFEWCQGNETLRALMFGFWFTDMSWFTRLKVTFEGSDDADEVEDREYEMVHFAEEQDELGSPSTRRQTSAPVGPSGIRSVFSTFFRGLGFRFGGGGEEAAWVEKA